MGDQPSGSSDDQAGDQEAETQSRCVNGAKPSFEYVPAIDGLRAIAIGAVIACHNFGLPTYFGVDVFFAISGFLITTLMWRELEAGSYRARVFYLKRVIRLMPALAVTVLASAVALLVVGFDTRQTLLGGLFALLYLTPFAPAFGVYGAFGHTWSLAIEEWFYALWGVMIPDLFRQHSRQTLGVAFIAMWAATLVIPDGLTYSAVLARGGGILLGAGVALVVVNHGSRGTTLWMLGGVACFVSAFVGAELGLSGRIVTMSAAAAGALICVGAAHGGGRWLGVWPLAWVGRWSYELYLVHYPILVISVNMAGGLDHLTAWLAMLISMVAAASLHYSFRPLQRQWRRRALVNA